jgi:hypothetical protein
VGRKYIFIVAHPFHHIATIIVGAAHLPLSLFTVTAPTTTLNHLTSTFASNSKPYTSLIDVSGDVVGREQMVVFVSYVNCEDLVKEIFISIVSVQSLEEALEKVLSINV